LRRRDFGVAPQDGEHVADAERCAVKDDRHLPPRAG
jgi:hypothetical protein